MEKTEFTPPSAIKQVTRISERVPARTASIEAFRFSSDRLDSWKEIASYVGREVRTVQLWEKLEGLPVHRHFHKKLGSVFAFRSEIDLWSNGISRPAAGFSTDGHEEPAAAPNVISVGKKNVMLAVLPFESLGDAPNQELFNSGVIAEIIAAVGRLCPERLGVISRISVMPYKGSERQLEKLGAELNVGYVLEGTTQVEGERIRVNVALVKVSDKTTLWSESYKSKFENFFQIQSRVAGQIANGIFQKLLPAVESIPALPAARPAARDAYLLGRYFLKQRNEEGLRKAVRYFEAAIRDDPRSALAHSGLADCLILLTFYEILLPREAMPSARRAALKAIELDPSSAEAHTSLADILFHFDRDWVRADEEYRLAIRCNPGYALSYQWYANLLIAKGQHEAAHVAIMQALELDPVSLVTIVWAGVTSHLARRYDEAMNYYRKALEIDPDFALAHMYMAQTLEQTGHIPEALAGFDKTIHLSSGSDCARAMKAHAHAVSGDRSTALRIVSDLSRRPHQRCLPSYDIAAVYAALKESGETVKWLSRAFVERNMKLFTLGQDPRFDAIRNVSEFKKLAGRVGPSFTTVPPRALAAKS